MATKKEKEPVVQEIKEKLQASKGVVLTDYRGLNVSAITELRRNLRAAGVEYKVVKNTLTSIAAKELGIEDIDTYLSGPTAIAYGLEDAVAPAKVIAEFAKNHKELEIKAGLLEGKVIGVDQIKALANLPSREVLLAKLLGSMQSPLYGMANVLQGNIRNLVYVLDAVRQKQEAQA